MVVLSRASHTVYLIRDIIRIRALQNGIILIFIKYCFTKKLQNPAARQLIRIYFSILKTE